MAYYLLGEGARHWVVGQTGSELVLRVDKIECGDADQQAEYHRAVVAKLFPNHVYPLQARIVREAICVSPLVCIKAGTCVLETRNVMSQYFCVELKPKFVGFRKFDPTILFSGGCMVAPLLAALSHPKRYLRIHCRPATLGDEAVVELVAHTLAKPEGQALLARLNTLHQFGADRFCKFASVVAKKNLDWCEDESGIFTDLDLFTEIAQQMESTYTLGVGQKWLRTFLTGRMAMDVSLMMNFESDATCSITVVDTDLKPVWKVPVYLAKAGESN